MFLKSSIIKTLMILIFFSTIVIQSIIFSNFEKLGRPADVADYSAYYIAGSLVNQGRPQAVYDTQATRLEQIKQFRNEDFLPWAYPPQFSLLTSLLAKLSIGTGYLVFELLSFAAFLFVLYRTCGGWFSAGLVFALPAILLNARCGQNGYLTAALIGAFLLWADTRWLRAGLALGAMVLKPHLAVAISMMALVRRKWATMAVAAGVVLGTSLLATALLGGSIWAQFLAATQVSGSYLEQGLFPLERMTSVYAALFRHGASAPVALAVQVAVALAMLGWLFVALSGTMARNRQMALVVLCTVLISPYNYDYDLVVLALFAGLMAPDIVSRASTAEVMGLVILGWATSANYPLALAIDAMMGNPTGPQHPSAVPPLSLYFLAAIVVWGLRILRRPETVDATEPTASAS